MGNPELKETQVAQRLEPTLRTWKQSGEKLLSNGEFILDPLFYRKWEYIPMYAESEYHDRTTAAHALIFLTEDFSDPENPDEAELFASHIIMTKEKREYFYKPAGGYLKKGETPNDAIKREVEKEETGLTNLQYTRIGTLYFPKDEDSEEEIVALYASVVDETTSFTQTSNSNTEQVTAILYTFFHSDFSLENVHDSFLVEQALREYLKGRPEQLQLLPRFQAT